MSAAKKNRIVLLDIIRSLALLGILLVHCHEHFGLSPTHPCEITYPYLANITSFIITHFIQGKAFLIFSFLFGLSFFIQIDKQSQKGIDFRFRFAWRLFILFSLGILHSSFYKNDILIVFAILGLILLFLNTFSNKSIICIIILLLALSLCSGETISTTPPTNIRKAFSIELIPDTQNNTNSIISNIYPGIINKFILLHNYGRLYLTLSFFLLGTLIGRTRFFEKIANKKKIVKQIIISSMIFCVAIIILKYNLSENFSQFFYILFNISFSIFIISCITLIYIINIIPPYITSYLASIGKCTLTCYISQTIFFIYIFSPYGLNISTSSYISAFLAISFFIVQAVISKLWLNHFLYGPIEWLWRSGTMTSFQPIKK